MSFCTCCENSPKLVSDANLEQINQTLPSVLSETGVKFTDAEVRRFLADHGCGVGFRAQVRLFPPVLHFSACSGIAILNVGTQQRRSGTLAHEVAAGALLAPRSLARRV